MNLPRRRATPRRKAHPVAPLPEHHQRRRSPEAQARRDTRTEDQRDARMDFRARVLASTPRGLGDCEGTPGCAHLGPHRGVHAHHRHPKGMGAGKGTDATTNGAWLCAPGHRWVHENVAAAMELGLLRTWSDPWPPDPNSEQETP